MKNVRVWFSKTGNMRFISHLDLNRCMLRTIQRSKLPVWRTEGYNPHPFINFSMPLSLGICGLKESMDIKILEDVSFTKISEQLNAYLPDGLHIIDVTEPVMKQSEISYARFIISMYSSKVCNNDILNSITSLLDKDEILVEKITKSNSKIINIKDYIVDYSIYDIDSVIKLKLTLPAGSKFNINPFLFLNTFDKNEILNNVSCIVFREKLLNSEMKDFC